MDKVIGMSAYAPTLVRVSPATGEVYYPAGAVVVVYNPRLHQQTRFLLSRSRRAIASMAMSRDGRFLAVGERGKNPAIVIWDVGSGDVVSTLTGHRFGVAAVSFSPFWQRSRLMWLHR